MKMTKDQCIAGVRKAFEDVPQEIFDDVKNEIFNITNEVSLASAEKTVRLEFYKQGRKQQSIQARNNAVRKIKALETNLETLRAFPEKKKIEGLKALIDGSYLELPGAGNSAYLDSIYVRENVYSLLLKELEARNLNKITQDPKALAEIEQNLYKELFALETGVVKAVTKDTVARSMAEAFSKVLNKLADFKLDAGIITRKLEGRMLGKYNDPEMMAKAGYGRWKQVTIETMGETNLAEAFPLIYKDAVKLDSALKEIYDNIIDGKPISLADDVGFISGYTPTSTKISKARVFKFKDGQAAYDYAKEFSGGNAFETLLRSIDREARDIAAVKKFGPNPESGFKTIINEVKKSITDDKIKQGFKGSERELQNLYNEAFTFRNVGHSSAAMIAREARAVTTMATLGAMTPKQLITDLGTGIMRLKSATGKNLFQATGDYIGSFAKLFTNPKEKKLLLENMNFLNRSAIGNFHGRFVTEDLQKPGVISKHMNKFFTLNLSNYFTDLTNATAINVHTKVIGDEIGSAIKIDQIKNPRIQKRLREFSIKDEHLPFLQKGKQKVFGSDVITIEGLQAAKAPQDLIRNYAALIRDQVRLSTPQPGVRESALLKAGVDPNSVAGVTLSLASQYKTFPMMMHRIMKKNLFTDTDELVTSGMQALRNNKFHIPMAVGSLATMGYIGATVDALIGGKTPPDPTDPKVIARSLVISGAGGLYGDFLLAEYDKNYRSVESDLLGPTIGSLADGFTLLQQGIQGNKDWGDAWDFVLRNTPGQNMPVIRPALDFLILREIDEALNPGRGQRRLKSMEERGQEPLAPMFDPTETAF